MLNKRLITLLVVCCRPFASKVRFGVILRNFSSPVTVRRRKGEGRKQLFETAPAPGRFSSNLGENQNPTLSKRSICVARFSLACSRLSISGSERKQRRAKNQAIEGERVGARGQGLEQARFSCASSKPSC